MTRLKNVKTLPGEELLAPELPKKIELRTRMLIERMSMVTLNLY